MVQKHYQSSQHIQKNNILPQEKWENPLSIQQKKYILSRFPNETIKLSYETVAPKKVLSTTEYDLCVAIPYGKKAYVWYTFCNHTSICLLMELNRDNQISDTISIFPNTTKIPKDFELGTIVSGTIYEEIEIEEEINPNKEPRKYFLVDDIHMYKGIAISTWCFHLKSGFLYDFLQKQTQNMSLSFFWNHEKEMPKIPYNVRFIQYRSTKQILPHYNVSSNKKPLWNPTIVSAVETYKPILQNKINMNWKFNYSRPIYKRNAFFWVKADIAFDVYYLGVINDHNTKQHEILYCQNALVLNFKTSVLLNTIFRNIRENQCLDIIEESDDEDDFEDVREDRFVDLNKECIMECYFHFKFKKWVPILVVSTEEHKNQIVSLQLLL
jgi:hypothetical protein